MQQSGPEEQELKRRAGSWTVKATFRPTPDAQPLVTEQASRSSGSAAKSKVA
jgi:hypothetical protein